MAKYTADYLYNEFKGLAGMRKGNSAYANDAGYWDGGQCNWGGCHVLREDCGTLARGFEKMENLDNNAIINELNKCTSQGEYESKKANYIRKANEISLGLQARTGYSSSMFGVCIIWADQAMSPYIESMMQDCRRELDSLKSQLGQGKYQHIEELKRLKLEQKQIEDRMKENKREAAKEKDPVKRAALLLLIEEDGKRLEENLRKQKEIPTSKIKFDPGKYVSDMIDGMKKAVERSNRGSSGNGSSGSGGSNRKKQPNSDPFADDNENSGVDGDSTWPDNNPRFPRKKNQPEQNSQQMLLIGIAALVIIFLLVSQKSDSLHRRYDEYDY